MSEMSKLSPVAKQELALHYALELYPMDKEKREEYMEQLLGEWDDGQGAS